MRRSVAALLLVASACSSETNPPTIAVASQNLYLGGDLNPITSATDATQAAAATYDLWKSVQATDFPARAKVIAAGIAAKNPDVVGLQEVATWRTGAPLVCAPGGSGLPVINAPQAPTVVYDFLASLQAELGALGLQYDVGAVTQSNDVELCAFKAGSGDAPIDLRYTDRDVILVRRGLATRNVSGGVYATYIPVPIPGTPVVVPQRRAWNVVEVQQGGSWVRVFETHLEVQEIEQAQPYGFVFQLAQAGELVAIVNQAGAAAPLPTILLGDMNSQAEQPGGSPLRITYNFLAQGMPFPPIDVVPWWPTALVGSVSPFADAWTQANPGQPGYTWGFSDDLRTGTPSQRIDLILATGGAGGGAMQTFGGTAMTSTNPPMHASDHLGVAAQIQLP